MRVYKKAPVPNTMALPSEASYVVKIKTKEKLLETLAFAKKEKLPFVPVGCGSNILPRKLVKAVVGIMRIRGIEQKNNVFEVGAGEIWDNFVKITVNKGFFGIESLSAIPGTVGACPIQNIGAYGTEAKDTIVSVEVYDCKKNKFHILKNKECKFGYRTSIFKQNPNRFVVTSVVFKLKSESGGAKWTRRAVIKMRKAKLPDYKKIPSAGSYFINPIIKNKKIFAGKLIEEAGLKGARVGKAEISPQNALILTNPHKASFEEIIKAEKIIRNKIYKKFKILLEREPVII